MEKFTGDAAPTCPECGAKRVDGMNCWEQLGAFIAWEYQDPELLAEHFLTVAAYNIQHPSMFTDEARAGLQTAFIDRLERNTPVQDLRQRAGKAYQGKKRVLKREVDRKPSLKMWSMTIADVYIPDRPEGAAARVRTWANTIRKELY